MKIGPYLTVENADFVPNMQTAFETDCECGGCHAANNELAVEINKLAPTILSMAYLIEKERNELEEIAQMLCNACCYPKTPRDFMRERREENLRTAKGEEPNAAH